MNNALADIIGFLNGLAALTIMILGGVWGWHMYPEVRVEQVLLGVGAGLVVALIVNGTLAVFVSMRAELIEIRGLLERQPPPKSDLL